MYKPVTACGAKKVAVVLAGGVGLGAYQAGAYGRLCSEFEPDWIAAASVGAVNAAIIAGNPPDRRLQALADYWKLDTDYIANRGEAEPREAFVSWLNVANWMSALQSRLMGAPGFFNLRPANLSRSPPALYDLGPTRARLERLVDFDRLNDGGIRLSIATTNIETGDLVLFDTARGTRIEMEHLLASCGLLPEFAPVEIDSRLLGDGALAANAPVDVVLGDPGDELKFCFVIDLFARDGARPTDLQTSQARRQELFFANQTHRQLVAWLERQAAEREAANGQSSLTVCYLSYRASPEEAGPEKGFDFSGRSIGARWREGALDMDEALNTVRGRAERGGLFKIRRTN